jgi:hypothetical protein
MKSHATGNKSVGTAEISHAALSIEQKHVKTSISIVAIIKFNNVYVAVEITVVNRVLEASQFDVSVN